MKILFAVNQKAAMLRGINAPSSTVELDIDPTDLPEDFRALIAEALKDGYDARGAITRDSRRYDICLEQPSLGGLLESLAAIQGKVAARRAEIAALEAEDQATLEAMIAEAKSTDVANLITGDNRLKSVRGYYNSRHGNLHSLSKWEGKTVASLAGREEEAKAEIARRKEAEQAAMDAQRLRNEESARRKAQDRESLMSRLPDGLRQRAQEGYASADEVDAELRNLIISDAGYSPIDADYSDDREALTTLTDEEYAFLVEKRNAAPEGSDVKPYAVWCGEWYRPATEEDDPLEIDSDGDVTIPLEERDGFRRGVRIKLPERGGVTAALFFPFPSANTTV